MNKMSHKITYVVVASIVTMVFAGCGRAQEPEPAMDYYEEPAAMEAGEAPIAAPPAQSAKASEYASVERLIIRNAWLDIVVSDTEEALNEIDEMVQELDGYVVESNTSQYQEGMQATVKLRIPADSLDVALDRIRDMATEIRSQNITGEDMTDEYVDLKSSLRHLEATEARLLEFLEEAEDTEAALAVYEQMQEVQSEIEHVKGRIQYLEQSAAMATISVAIVPDALAQPIQVGGWHPEGTLRNAFQSLIRVLQFLVNAAIVIIVLIIPVLVAIAIPIVGTFLVVRTIVRRRRARKANQPEA